MTGSRSHMHSWKHWLRLLPILFLLPACALIPGPATPTATIPAPGPEDITPVDGGPVTEPTIEPTEEVILPGSVLLESTVTANSFEAGVVDLPFEAREQLVIRVDATLVAGVLDFDLEVVDQFGNVLAREGARSGATQVAITEITLPFDGSYVVRLAPQSGGGNVRVVATALDAPSGGGVLDAVGQELRGAITARGVYHTYQFPLLQGETVTIGAYAPGRATPDTRALLIGPDGRFIMEFDDTRPPEDLNAVFTGFTASLAGKYTAIVSAVEGTTGEYTFRVTADSQAPETAGTPDIAYNNEYRVALIEGDPLSLTFDGQVGDPLRIEAFNVVDTLDVDIRVYSPFGQIIAFSVDDDDEPGDDQVLAEMQLPYAGRYRLELTPNGSGEASFRILKLQVADLTGGGIFGKDLSGTRSGLIAEPNVFHYFQFDANSGDEITIRIISDTESGTLDLGFAILGPTGTQVVFADDASGEDTTDPALTNYRLTQTGTFTIVVYSLTEGTGSYTLSYSRQ